MASDEERFDSRHDTVALAAILTIAALLRFSTWTRVFIDGRVYLDQNDGWYHLRHAWLILQRWPSFPQADPWLNAPFGSPISWPPLYDWLLATLALPWASREALEVIGALVPPLLGLGGIVVLYVLVRDLAGSRAALIAASTAAVLPGVVRYTLVGALDHDPFYELCALVALLGLRRSWLVVAVGISAAYLSWPGAPVLPAVLACVLLATRDREMFERGAAGSLAAAAVILPFVAAGPWQEATFHGLSLLHEFTLVAFAAFAGIASAALGSRGRKTIAIVAVSGIAAAILLKPVAESLLGGIAFAAGENAMLATVAESRPMLSLLGGPDLRPLLVRLTLLPLIGIVLLAARVKSRPHAFLLGWLVPTTVLALLHSRFTFGAAIATCAFAGLFFDEMLTRYPRGRVALAAVVLTAPILTAYLPVRGWEPFNFYRRGIALRDTGMDGITERLALREPGIIYAPWSFGHWILWKSQRPVVTSPFLSTAQGNFPAAMRLYFETDPRRALAMLDRWDVRYVIVTAEPPDLRGYAEVAGVDASVLVTKDGRIDLENYLRTVPARLALDGAFGPFVEIDRSEAMVPGPLGPVPLVRVYEIRAGKSQQGEDRQGLSSSRLPPAQPSSWFLLTLI